MTAVTPVLMHWSYCSLALSGRSLPGTSYKLQLYWVSYTPHGWHSLGWMALKTPTSETPDLEVMWPPSPFNTSGPDPLGFDWEDLAASCGTVGGHSGPPPIKHPRDSRNTVTICHGHSSRQCVICCVTFHVIEALSPRSSIITQVC